MLTEDYRDAAIVLLAHGSTVNPDSGGPAFLHADTLRRRGVFGEVTEAFWKQEPFVGGVLRGLFASRVFFVPLFVSEGWFTEQVLPEALGFKAAGESGFERVVRREERTLHYCRPVGSHPSMTGVLLARARSVVERHPFPRAPKPAETTLFVAGHGTSYARGSREAIERQVALLRDSAGYAAVHPLFLEEEPRISECWSLAATKNLVLVPYFVSDGLHTREDIPIALGESQATVRGRLAAGQPTWRNPTERGGKRLWLGAAAGTEPLVVDVILERVREAAAWAAQRLSSASTGA
ncbi:MAG: hypothetical protein JNL97_03900 [Verrucomicrobiales bacterium]|nr:hypothetical protein [Verrucomicrobiales bacterium]